MVLTCTHNLCFGQKEKKNIHVLGIVLYTQVLLNKSGVYIACKYFLDVMLHSKIRGNLKKKVRRVVSIYGCIGHNLGIVTF